MMACEQVFAMADEVATAGEMSISDGVATAGEEIRWHAAR
jgi:hypothetical protein